MFGSPSQSSAPARPRPRRFQRKQNTWSEHFSPSKLGSIRKGLRTHVSNVRWLQVICKLFRQQRESESGNQGKSPSNALKMDSLKSRLGVARNVVKDSDGTLPQGTPR